MIHAYYRKLKYKLAFDKDKKYVEFPTVWWDDKKYPIFSSRHKYAVVAIFNGTHRVDVCKHASIYDAVYAANGIAKMLKSMSYIYGKDVDVKVDVIEDRKNSSKEMDKRPRLTMYTELGLSPEDYLTISDKAMALDVSIKAYVNLLFYNLKEAIMMSSFVKKSSEGYNLANVKRLKDFFLMHNRSGIGVKDLVVTAKEWLSPQARPQDVLDVVHDALKSEFFYRTHAKTSIDTIRLRPTYSLYKNKNLKPIGASDDEGDTNSVDDIQDDFDEEET